jgi:AbrB family looped-hinge helix DNA binding protein
MILIFQKSINSLKAITILEVRKMAKKKKDESCCGPPGKDMSCCKVESVVSVDDRGQMVLPKELRQRANINAGDKLAVISMEKGDKVCCFALIKVGEFEGMVKNFLGPMMKEMF